MGVWRWQAAFLSFAVCMVLASRLAAAEGVEVVFSAAAGRTLVHAGDELEHYVAQLTGQPAARVERPHQDRLNLIVTTSPQDWQGGGWAGQVPDELASDEFVVVGGRWQGGRAVLLAGGSEAAALWAAYEYLERFCDVGFFQDGEYVPKLSRLPSVGVYYLGKPRFPDRHHFAWTAHRGLTKFHACQWQFEDWKHELDWMAKHHYNLMRQQMYPMDQMSGDSFQQAFPEVGPAKMEQEAVYAYEGGWPVSPMWPGAYRTQLAQRVFDYARMLGIRIVHHVDVTGVTYEFQDAHPDLKYMPPNQYGRSSELDPNEPRLKEIGVRFLRKQIELFGTDHYFMFSPFVELGMMGDTPEEGARFRALAANKVWEIVHEADSEAVWVTDAWDMYDNRQGQWTKDTARLFFSLVPECYMYDTGADLPDDFNEAGRGYRGPAYARFDYFSGNPWTFGIVTDFAGDDWPRGNAERVLERLRHVAADPGAANCRGIWNIPEITHQNILYWDVMAHASWDPASFDLQRYVRELCKRRYGAQSAGVMHRAVLDLFKACHSEDWIPYFFHRMQYEGFGSPTGFPLVEGREAEEIDALCKLVRILPVLREAIEIALTEQLHQRNNPLYENDLVDWTRTYLAYVSDFNLILAHQAFKNGDVKKMREASHRALTALEADERLLSTRPDFSLEASIRQVMSVPGANPETPALIKRGATVGDYGCTDNAEQMHFYFRPKVEAYTDKLREKAQAGERTISIADVRPTWDRIWREFEANPIALPRSARFRGTPLGAVRAAMDLTAAFPVAVPDYPSLPAYIREGKKQDYLFERNYALECRAADLADLPEIVEARDVLADKTGWGIAPSCGLGGTGRGEVVIRLPDSQALVSALLHGKAQLNRVGVEVYVSRGAEKWVQVGAYSNAGYGYGFTVNLDPYLSGEGDVYLKFVFTDDDGAEQPSLLNIKVVGDVAGAVRTGDKPGPLAE